MDAVAAAALAPSALPGWDGAQLGKTCWAFGALRHRHDGLLRAASRHANMRAEWLSSGARGDGDSISVRSSSSGSGSSSSSDSSGSPAAMPSTCGDSPIPPAELWGLVRVAWSLTRFCSDAGPLLRALQPSLDDQLVSLTEAAQDAWFGGDNAAGAAGARAADLEAVSLLLEPLAQQLQASRGDAWERACGETALLALTLLAVSQEAAAAGQSTIRAGASGQGDTEGGGGGGNSNSGADELLDISFKSVKTEGSRGGEDAGRTRPGGGGGGDGEESGAKLMRVARAAIALSDAGWEIDAVSARLGAAAGGGGCGLLADALGLWRRREVAGSAGLAGVEHASSAAAVGYSGDHGGDASGAGTVQGDGAGAARAGAAVGRGTMEIVRAGLARTRDQAALSSALASLGVTAVRAGRPTADGLFVATVWAQSGGRQLAFEVVDSVRPGTSIQ
ncbi:hypothetical protein FOA52_009172 [Chlamydomonas sp. UWO 241]|nr:hypothetical protein FOA52_009172 [Chlamydomonas sp. UWO 241]